jgi:hypothetical protein
LIDETVSAKRARLTGEGWIEDGATGKNYTDAKTSSITKRKSIIAGSKTMSYYMRPNLSMFKQKRLIPPGVAIRLVFNRSATASCIMSSNANEDVKLVITKFEWMVRRVSINPTIVRAHTSRMIEGNTYKFPIKKHRTRVHNIPAGVSSHRLVIDQDDIVPTRILLAMLDHEGFVGTFKKSPYAFNHFELSNIEMSIDGVPVGKSIETDFSNGNYAHAYAHTLASLGHLNSTQSNGISYDDYVDNRTVFAWCTASDLPNKDKDNYFHLRRKGCTAVVLRFKTPLATPLSVLITDEREDLLEIDLEQRIKSVTGVV